ncbi:MAG: hypothetical protein R3281_03705 [Balneolaceae bacterium]|nr:hypothetical protein [Balneolaceae bacterium]
MSKVTVSIAAVSVMVTMGFTDNQAQDNLPTVEQQIEAAVQAAPPNKRDGAKVLGYSNSGQLVTLRNGSNELICLSDDPESEGFHVACYYRELEPFMKRGRELRAQGLSRSKVDSIRKSEIEAGKLHYPDRPMALYSLSGPEDGYDYQAGEVLKANPLYVVYVPYATEESTGISSAPAGEGGSWLMEPGTPWSHIMIPGQPIDANNSADQ